MVSGVVRWSSGEVACCVDQMAIIISVPFPT